MVIEEITEEVETTSSQKLGASAECSASQPQQTVDAPNHQSRANGRGSTNSGSLHALKDDPEAIRLFHIHLKVSLLFIVYLCMQFFRLAFFIIINFIVVVGIIVIITTIILFVLVPFVTLMVAYNDNLTQLSEL